ncbi:YeeE/YedE family protein [Nesterenkonia aerolata]|uniref:YeeE/YedE family protein n=1 Tax=Nesterenkonia aerolata TaxID=3074079 RepID=A0ABU2DPP9_9MICC|nr:YeeE/YedE family protein [Nesterenkonia sp. LY-0111]MDR8018428.1 YeeE/YedE family protein [Nesterenkonia sp. LY-0111]
MIITGLILGTVLGFVFQRGRFCVTGAFRDLFTIKSTRWFTAFMVIVAVQSIGVFALDALGVIQLDGGTFPWLGTIIGGFIFGFAIILAGGCATGTYYRAGEGLVGSWFALIFYIAGAAAFRFGPLSGTTDAVRSVEIQNGTLQDALGVTPWILVILLVAGVGVAVLRQLNRERQITKVQLPAMKTGIAHVLTEKTWHPFVTAAIIGIIAIAAWPLSWATGRESGLGITGPSAHIGVFLGTGDMALVDWGMMLVLGLLIGSFIAAKASGEFKIRVPDARTTVRSIIGGLGMGWGAAWAGGCTIGNAMVNTATFSFQGWTALLFMILGTGVAAKIFIMGHKREGATATPKLTTVS